MSATDTDVIIRYMRVEFTGVAPFSDRKGWVIRSFSDSDGLVQRTLQRRKAWTVARDAMTVRGASDETADIASRYRGLASSAMQAVVLPDTPPCQRYGTLLIIEEVKR